MELIYTKRDTGFEAGKNYRNPTYFDRIEKATSVVMDGDFPAVRAAYEDAGVPVTDMAPAAKQDTKPARGKKSDPAATEPESSET